jgi:hypothetical protein
MPLPPFLSFFLPRPPLSSCCFIIHPRHVVDPSVRPEYQRYWLDQHNFVRGGRDRVRQSQGAEDVLLYLHHHVYTLQWACLVWGRIDRLRTPRFSHMTIWLHVPLIGTFNDRVVLPLLHNIGDSPPTSLMLL